MGASLRASRDRLVGVELGLFDEVADLVRSMVPDELGPAYSRAHRRGVKVWFDSEKPGKEHYEAQFITSQGSGLSLEVGFHAENRDPHENQAALDRLIAAESQWRPQLGQEAEAGPFIGQDAWRRLSDVWSDVDIDDEDLAFEIAGRLVDYVSLIEPVRRT